jgi:hypothetical protein
MNDAKHVQAQGFPPHPTANCPGFRDGFLEIVSGILTHFNVSTEIAVIFLNQVSKVTHRFCISCSSTSTGADCVLLKRKTICIGLDPTGIGLG